MGIMLFPWTTFLEKKVKLLNLSEEGLSIFSKAAIMLSKDLSEKLMLKVCSRQRQVAKNHL
jgi:hypothetical protein